MKFFLIKALNCQISDINYILNNDIDGNGLSPMGIYASGTASPADNKSINISGNKIHDYYSDAAAITRNAGIQISNNNDKSKFK